VPADAVLRVVADTSRDEKLFSTIFRLIWSFTSFLSDRLILNMFRG
jgi:hypothetical protein